MTHHVTNETAAETPAKLPLRSLLALSTAAFLGIMTEALPAGILPAMSNGLGVSEAAAGQTITIFAIGSISAAIPLTAATTEWPRKRVLVLALIGFVIGNSVTAMSENYVLTMTSRFLGGVVAGMLWALMAGYARRLVSPAQRGRATTIALAGIPIALSLGVPVGTFLSDQIGWRSTLGLVSALTVALVIWVVLVVPDFPGSPRESSMSLKDVVALPGVLPVLATALAFVLAHNILYTYVAPFIADTGLSIRVDTLLLVFGIASVIGIWITGSLIDRHLRNLALAIIVLFAVAAFGLAVLDGVAPAVYVSSVLWGLAFGGAAPVMQTAAADAAGENAVDVTQSLLVTTWNIAIASGASVGGLLLNNAGASALAWGPLALLAIALLVALSARQHGFPSVVRRVARDKGRWRPPGKRVLPNPSIDTNETSQS